MGTVTGPHVRAHARHAQLLQHPPLVADAGLGLSIEQQLEADDVTHRPPQ
ncbi:hypothetical protein [Pseudoclavibacter sp. AY1F1]|nr:hypothetical protein [Pseudoclavibacter sp. AY1F1]